MKLPPILSLVSVMLIFVFGTNVEALKLRRFSTRRGPTFRRATKFHSPNATVTVPIGWKVISGGASTEYSGPGQFLTKTYPSNGNRAWSVESKDHIISDPGTIQAFAIAIYDPKDKWDVIIRTSQSSKAARPVAYAKLPAGYTLVGGGANALWSGAGSLLVRNHPSDPSTWVTSSTEHHRSSPASVISYVIGIKSRTGKPFTTEIVSGWRGPRAHPYLTINPPNGYKFIGGGAQVTRGGYGNMLVRIVPDIDGSWLYAFARDNIMFDRQKLGVYGIVASESDVKYG